MAKFNQHSEVLKSINPLNPKIMKNSRTFESFENFLANIYSRQNNGQFLSKENYKSHVRNVIKSLGVTEEHFLNAELKQLKIWKIQIQDKPAFNLFSKAHRSDLKSGFEAFINYGRYQAGLAKY